MRIYEVKKGHCLDLAKIVSIKQHYDAVEKKSRTSRLLYDAWIEVTIDSGRRLAIDCQNLDDMRETYLLLLRAWQTYVGDELEEPEIKLI